MVDTLYEFNHSPAELQRAMGSRPCGTGLTGLTTAKLLRPLVSLVYLLCR